LFLGAPTPRRPGSLAGGPIGHGRTLNKKKTKKQKPKKPTNKKTTQK
jgi:hypothetical protein